MPLCGYSVVHVISTTRHEEREHLGEKITEWLAQHPQLTVVEALVLQSSDSTHHCLAAFLFLKETP